MDNDKKSPEESFDPHCTFSMVILNISATIVHFLYNHIIRSNGSISELHKSLDMMTDNLNQMCMTLQTKLEEQMHTVAKMNSVMESYILKHIEVTPSLESTSSTSCCFKVCVHNASRLPLQDVSLHFESSSTNSEHPLFQISDSEPSQSVTSKSFELQQDESHVIDICVIGEAKCSVDVIVTMQSPGTGNEISKTCSFFAFAE
ncbi:hypothetical protein WA171_001252 [Blastocystis sp. BT1]